MKQTPAKRVAPEGARAPGKSAPKPAAKRAARPAAHAAKKVARKTPVASKGTSLRASPKPAVKAQIKKAPKAVSRSTTTNKQPAVKSAAAKSTAPASRTAGAVTATHAPASTPRAATPAPARPAGAKPAGTTGAPAPSPPITVPGASRFADRFSPARPPARVGVAPAVDTRPPARTDPKLANAWKQKAGRDLSEDELLAMPDSEYMNEKQLDFFRARLQALKDDLLSNAGLTTEHLREDTSIVPDPADRATIEEEHALELRTRDRERKLLKKISQSLARIDSGDYGFCDETGEPIGLRRLVARPTATLSLEAQQRREMKQKMFGD